MYAMGQYGNYWSYYYGALAAYGTLSLTDSSPAQVFVEPCTVKELRSYLKIPSRIPEDDDEDAFLASIITASRDMAEILQGRDLVPKQYDLALDYWATYKIELRPALQSVDLVQYTDSDLALHTLQETTDYIVDKQKQPGVICPPYNVTWPTFTPTPTSAMLFRFTAGYPAAHPWWMGAGQRVIVGMKLLMSHWYNNRMVFEKGVSASDEYPYAVTALLSYGSLVRAR
jgi:uncharacterized phiE125 gp8 family phage protein